MDGKRSILGDFVNASEGSTTAPQTAPAETRRPAKVRRKLGDTFIATSDLPTEEGPSTAAAGAKRHVTRKDGGGLGC